MPHMKTDHVCVCVFPLHLLSEYFLLCADVFGFERIPVLIQLYVRTHAHRDNNGELIFV